MKGYLSLSHSGAPEIGEFVKLTILVDEKLESGGWRVKGDGRWIPSGGLTLLADSLEEAPAEGGNSKFTLQALVHQHGALRSGPFSLIHAGNGIEVEIPASDLSREVARVEIGQEPPRWVLPPVPLGGWNYILIAVVALAAAGILGLLFRRLLRKMRGRRAKDHRTLAIQALQSLQKYAKAKKPLKQEEWKKFSFELAGIIRRFSDVNFRIDSRDLTDREFLSELRLQPKASGKVDSLSQILSTIDEVRYGKKDLDATIVPGLLLESRKFVEQTYQNWEEGPEA